MKIKGPVGIALVIFVVITVNIIAAGLLQHAPDTATVMNSGVSIVSVTKNKTPQPAPVVIKNTTSTPSKATVTELQPTTPTPAPKPVRKTRAS